MSQEIQPPPVVREYTIFDLVEAGLISNLDLQRLEDIRSLNNTK